MGNGKSPKRIYLACISGRPLDVLYSYIGIAS